MNKPVQYSLCLSRLVGRSRWRCADLREADLRGADLSWADLREADLREANLYGADLWWADLREADLKKADLVGASLREATLREADLKGADLRKADLVGASLWRADLQEATRYDRMATPLVCALAKVGAPWYCIQWEWGDRHWKRTKPHDFDHWAGVAKLYMLGVENE